MPAEILQALRASLQKHSRFLWRSYLLATLTLVAAAGLGQVYAGNALFFFVDLDQIERLGQGAVTLASSLCLGVTGLCFGLVARQEKFAAAHARSASRPSGHSNLASLASRLGWIAAGVGLIYLGFDEALAIHEAMTQKIAAVGVPKLFGVDQDVYIFLGYAAAALGIGSCLGPSLWHYRSALFPLAAMFGFFAASEILDFIPWDSLSTAQQAGLGPAEEILKTLGSVSALLYGILLLEAAIEARISGLELAARIAPVAEHGRT